MVLIDIFKLIKSISKFPLINLLLVILLFFITSLFEMYGLYLFKPLMTFFINFDQNLFDNLIEVNFIFISLDLNLLNFFMIFLSFHLIKNLILILTFYLHFHLSAKLQSILMTKLYDHYLNLPLNTIVSLKKGDIVRNISTDVVNFINNGYLQGIILINEIFLVFSILLLLIYLNPIPTILVIIISFFLFFFFQKSTKSILLNAGKQNQKSISKIITFVQESYNFFKEIKIYKIENIFIKKLNNHSNIFATGIKKNLFIGSLPKIYIEILFFLTFFILIFMTDYMGTKSGNLIPIIAVFGASALRLMPSISKILNSISSIRFGNESVILIKNFLKLKRNENIIANLKATPLNYDLQINNIFFRYQNSEKNILNNISFSVNEGQMLGIRGKSGVGKSTLVNIISGLIKPDRGKIKLGDIELNQTNFNLLSDSMSYVPQDIFIIDEDLETNITLEYDKSKIDYDKFRLVIAQSELQEYVAELKKNNTYQLELGSDGLTSSGGQKQRIAIARALYRNSKIIIFDEATSALDQETELKIIHQLKKLNKLGISIIFISHRVMDEDFFDNVITLNKQ